MKLASLPAKSLGYQQLHSSLPSFQWEATTSAWMPGTSSGHNIERKEISFITYNVWFSSKEWIVRADALISLISQKDPDVVCLQEVTPKLLTHFLKSETIRKHYHVTDCTGASVMPYGTAIFSKIPFTKLSRLDLPTSQGRCFLLGEFVVNNKKVRVGTVHLESLQPNAARRAEQLQIIFSALSSQHADYAATLVMGDFNFCSYGKWEHENANIDPSFVDLWPHLHPDLKGYTEDTTVNHMLAAERKELKQVRYDRVIMRSQSWTPSRIEVLGTTAIAHAPEALFISDHFGLAAAIRAIE